MHNHPRGQLLWAVEGVLRVTDGHGVWIVPPSHAVWIPGGMAHHMVCETRAELLNLYVDPSRDPRSGQAKGRGGGCVVLMLTTLARALILRLGESDTAQAFDASLRNLAEVTLDEIARLQEAPLSLPGGQDSRLTRVTRHLVAHPADPRPLTDLALLAAASPRTLERLFRKETGLNFRQWRGRLRLLAAVEALHQGQSSTAIAWSLGYRSPSAFVAAFRAHFGLPPQKFLQGAQAG